MKSIWDVPFIVVDIESNGSKAEKDRIIDISCITLLGGEIVSEFSSLVRPHQFIPQFISNMTGITNEMVAVAPEDHEVLPSVHNILSTKDAIFVAHNVSFDFNFIKTAMQRLKMTMPDIEKLCTLKLARRLLPRRIKKNVGNLADYYSVPVHGRHRAYGDAMATAEILFEFLQLLESEHNIHSAEELLKFQNRASKHYVNEAKYQSRLDKYLKNIPETPGVYYFLNKNKEVIYVGKAKSLIKRVKTYFGGYSHSSKKTIEIANRTYDIKWKECPTELSALLFESKEIKRLQPKYNSISKRYRNFTFIKLNTKEEYPVISITYHMDDPDSEYYGPFNNSDLAKTVLQIIDKQFKLRSCDKSIKEDTPIVPCLNYYIESCSSPCSGKTSRALYQKEIDKVRAFLSGQQNGIIDYLHNKMDEYSENLEFEKAQEMRDYIMELRKLFSSSRKLHNSINKNDLILKMPVDAHEDHFQLFLLKSGKLYTELYLRNQDNISQVKETIQKVYFNGQSSITYSAQDIDELKIVNSWLYRQRAIGKFIYVNKQNLDQILNDIYS